MLFPQLFKVLKSHCLFEGISTQSSLTGLGQGHHENMVLQLYGEHYGYLQAHMPINYISSS